MRTHPNRPSDDDSYLASVSDLMVGLLFIFIILLMAFALNYRAAEAEADRTETELRDAGAGIAAAREALAAELAEAAAERDALRQRQEAVGTVAMQLLARDAARGDLLASLEASLRANDVAASIDVDNGVLRLPEQLLFASGEAELRPGGEAVLTVLAHALLGTVPCLSVAPSELRSGCATATTEPVLEAVLVEGHTDDQPIVNSAFADNWQLSTARSTNTFKALVAARPELELLRNVRGEALIGISGYEARRPVAQGQSGEARRLNRRIDLRFIVAAPAREILAAMRSRLLDGAGAP